ncbi:hypothetical protein NDU88_004132 [Pleurodeles waltl]|uniref:Uncharacterized protein n=1 Tax=Pleurodeles waltl TaxID=8319 RepID=A0AAV7NLE3_PLEWA|nr:hypothetical protein NDU88_004132 [Pleurodeles waltl]
MQDRRSHPKNNSNTRVPYLSSWAKMTHGWEAEPENDANPDLRQILAHGAGQALKWGKHTTTSGQLTQATSLLKKDDMDVLLMQHVRRGRAQDQQQQLPPHQHGHQRQHRRQERLFGTRTTLLGLREYDIIQRYRLNWQAIQQLLRQIEPQLAASLQTPHIIPPET